MSASEDFAAAVRDLRQMFEWSQAGLCAALKMRGVVMDTSAISRIESGLRQVRLNEAEAIASCFDIPLASMLSAGPELRQRRAALEVHRRNQMADLVRLAFGTAQTPAGGGAA